MTERELQDALIKLAALRGWLVYHTWTSIHSSPGFPDLVFARDRDLIFMEVKGPRGRLSPAQKQWLDALAAAGQEAYVVVPDDRAPFADGVISYDTAIGILNVPRKAVAR